MVSNALDSLFTSVFPTADEPGAAVLILRGDEVIYDKGFGLADLSTSASIDGNTFFNIASCSKQFTAVAVLQLAQSGKLSLTDKVRDYFPEYTDPIWNDIEIRHLLSHSSGIPVERGHLTRKQKIYADEELSVAFMKTLDHLHFAPGTQYEYVNPTFVLLGKIVERVSGMEFTEYVHDNIFVPSGMDMTLYFDRNHQELIPAMAHGYESVNGKWRKGDFGEESFFATKPDGGIYTSTRQFARWEKALREGKVLGNTWLEQAWTPYIEVSGSRWSDYQNRPGTWYGYGWFIEPRPDDNGPVIYHTGDNGGFKILAARYPASDTLVLVFANRADWDRHSVRTAIESILFKS